MMKKENTAPRRDQQKRVTARDVIEGKERVPLSMDLEPMEGRWGAFLDGIQKRRKHARAVSIIRRAFGVRTQNAQAPDMDHYAVTAIIRADGVLEVWLMSRSWRTITITSRHRRVHMVHDDQGHIAGAVPAGRLAQAVAFMADANG